MNNLLIVVIAIVGFCYLDENNCPKVLKDNKEMLLGVLFSMVLCLFFDLKLEGFSSMNECLNNCQGLQEACNIYWGNTSDCNEIRRFYDAQREEEEAQVRSMLPKIIPSPTPKIEYINLNEVSAVTENSVDTTSEMCKLCEIMCN